MRKKLFAILMSAMMMVTFMPAMAFAGPVPGEPAPAAPKFTETQVNAQKAKLGEHNWEYDDEASVASTCTTEGVMVFKCAGHVAGNATVECPVVQKVVMPTDNTAHELKTVKLTPEEIVTYEAKQMAFVDEAAAAAELARLQAGTCQYYYVEQCKICGEYDVEDARPIGCLVDVTSTCAEVTCPVCGNVYQGTAAHKYGNDELIATNCCGYQYIYGQTCSVCGDVKVTRRDGVGEFKHSFGAEVDRAVATRHGAVKDGYFQIGTKFYAYNEVKVKPGCATEGKGVLKCEVCQRYVEKSGFNFNARSDMDKDLKDAETTDIAALGHTEKVLTVPATCELGEFSLTYCTKCYSLKKLDGSWAEVTPSLNLYDFVSFNRTKPATGHDYEVVVKQEPTCNRDGIVVVRCKNCEKEIWSEEDEFKFHLDRNGKFDGFNNRGRRGENANIELPKYAMLAHQMTGVKTVKEATCQHGTIEAKTCEACGAWFYVESIGDKLEHDLKVIEVKATCSEPGYTEEVCQREGCEYRKVLSETPALVGTGVACTPAEDWTTVTPATFTKVGTRVKYCVVCGAECAKDDIAKLTLKRAYIPKLVAGSKKITVKVTKETKNATGYQIAYKVAGNNNYKFVKTTNLSKTIKNLKKGTKYCFKIRAYAVEDGKTFYGAYCTVKYCKAK